MCFDDHMNPCAFVFILFSNMNPSKDPLNSNPDLDYVRNINYDSTELETDFRTTIKQDLPTILTNVDSSIAKLKPTISLIIDKKLVSQGTWLPNLRLVRITDNKNLKQYVPRLINGENQVMNRFESLFLLECRSLSITYENIPLSIEDGFQLMLNSKRDQKLYRVFSTLSKNGYLVKFLEKVKHGENQLEISGKHQLENSLDTELTNSKKFKHNNDSLLNYKVMTSVRPLLIGNLRKLSRTDKRLLKKCCQSEDCSDKSIIYCLRDSVHPVPVNQNLQTIFSGDIKPLIPLSDIYSTDNLFSLMRNYGPKDSTSHSTIMNSNSLSIDFEVYRSKSFSTLSKSLPLFCISIVNETDELPSTSQLNHLRNIVIKNCPLLFAVVSDSLEFNFYGLENVTIDDELPSLWEKYYA